MEKLTKDEKAGVILFFVFVICFPILSIVLSWFFNFPIFNRTIFIGPFIEVVLLIIGVCVYFYEG